MKVAAWQLPLLPAGSPAAVNLMRECVARCESEGVSVLCFPEAILGGLPDYSSDIARFAIRTDDGQLDLILAPLGSKTVTSSVGFTELAPDGRLFNAAAVVHHGHVAGLYRKHRPAIHRSVYSPGSESPVFRVGDLTFGIVICYDSRFGEPAAGMARQGATALFVPTNNDLPPNRARPEIAREARASDIESAVQNRVRVIRADTGKPGPRIVDIDAGTGGPNFVRRVQ